MESILNTMKMAKKNQKVITKMERKKACIRFGMRMAKEQKRQTGIMVFVEKSLIGMRMENRFEKT